MVSKWMACFWLVFTNGWLIYKFLTFFCLGNIDQKVVVHNLAERKCEINHAHRMSSIAGLDWISDTTLVSAGGDGSLKQWSISFN